MSMTSETNCAVLCPGLVWSGICMVCNPMLCYGARFNKDTGILTNINLFNHELEECFGRLKNSGNTFLQSCVIYTLY